MSHLNPAELRSLARAGALEHIKRILAVFPDLLAELQAGAGSANGARPRRRPLSAAARQRIARAQRARWRKLRREEKAAAR